MHEEKQTKKYVYSSGTISRSQAWKNTLSLGPDLK